MKNTLLLVIILLLSKNIKAADAPDHTLPLDPKFMGVHTMVLMDNESTLFASHLPSYNLPHNAQILYSVLVDNPPLLRLVRDADFVSIKPKAFNLQRLIRGGELTLNADVYMGHFERGGKLIFENMDITLKEQLYLRMLDKLEAPSGIQKYDTVLLKDNQKILVHQIQAPPSYDHLILFYDDVNCITQFPTRSAVPAQDKLNQKLSFCGSMKPLHYATEDFKE
ncbi:MAG: hypothetical protein ACI8Z9_000762 [Paraglaciecola sp.]|jgi:hypothetical protein